MTQAEGIPEITSLPAPPPLFRLEQVRVQFGPQLVLRDLHLDIPRGVTTVIIGESGCGKTVLLKLLVGLLRPNAGKVFFDNRDLAQLSEPELMRQRLRVGFVFQGGALFDSMTVFDNVAFPLRMHTDWSEERIRERVRQRLSEVGLSAAAEQKKPAELSGGMKKRVALARALALQPEVMLYDEPTTGLDPVMSAVINELIHETNRRHRVTSIVVTHDLQTIRRVADRVVMLHPVTRLRPAEPQVIFQGTSEELWTASDPRVQQFVRAEPGDRFLENADASAQAAADRSRPGGAL
ncbi:MAG: ABC transporter ATP-binding protein [Gemmataceae bacterium]